MINSLQDIFVFSKCIRRIRSLLIHSVMCYVLWNNNSNQVLTNWMSYTAKLTSDKASFRHSFLHAEQAHLGLRPVGFCLRCRRNSYPTINTWSLQCRLVRLGSLQNASEVHHKIAFDNAPPAVSDWLLHAREKS